MTLFVSLAVAMTAVVLGWLFLPLILRRTSVVPIPNSTELNASIYREQWDQLEEDFRVGRISQDEFQQSKDALTRRLLEDTAQTEPETATALVPPSRSVMGILATIVAAGATAMYWWLGSPQSVDPQASRVATQAQIESMVSTLAAKLEANPDNPQGWAMLARSYKVMGRFDAAAQAYARAMPLVEKDADMLVEYADVLALSQNSNLQGLPTQLLDKAVTLQPQHVMGLLMLGVSAYQREDHATAIQHWERLLVLLEPGSPDASQVEENIAQARKAMDQRKTPAKGPKATKP